MKPNFYQFSATSLQGKEIDMKSYEGKIVLVVNTASKCGLTPQYEGLEKLHKEYKDKGLVILGFPCNQFANQERGTDAQIQEFCRVNYGVTFDMFAKVEVNGAQAHPLFRRLKAAAPGVLGTGAIKWNFTKFLVDPAGKAVRRYAPQVAPDRIAADIEAMLPGG